MTRSPKIITAAIAAILAAPAFVSFTTAARAEDKPAVAAPAGEANKLSADCPFGAVASSLYRKLCERGFADDNESRIIDVLRG